MKNIIETLEGIDKRLARTKAVLKRLNIEREFAIGSMPVAQMVDIVKKIHPKCDWFSVSEVTSLKLKTSIGKIVCFGSDFKIGFFVENDPRKEGFGRPRGPYGISFNFGSILTGIYPIASQPGSQGMEGMDGAKSIAQVARNLRLNVLVAHDHNYNFCGSWISETIKPIHLIDTNRHDNMESLHLEISKLIPLNYSGKTAEKFFQMLELVIRVTTEEGEQSGLEKFERYPLLNGKKYPWKIQGPKLPKPYEPIDEPQSWWEKNIEDSEYRDAMHGENTD